LRYAYLPSVLIWSLALLYTRDLYFASYAVYISLPSFPTRRASDLVLLKNQGSTLPLAPSTDSVLVVGELARTPRIQGGVRARGQDRKSTRLNSSHVSISYAVFCWK